jgi:magnesium transporter
MPRKEQTIAEGLIWIDIVDPSASEMDELSKQYNLNQHTVRDCLEPNHLPKYEFDNGVHFMILRFYAHKFDQKLVGIQELTNKIAIFCNDQFIITIHKFEVPFLDVLRNKYVTTDKCSATTQVLTRIVWEALETFDDPANRISEQVDFFENQVILKRTDHDLVESLYFIKRQASVSHKILMLMQEPINHLQPLPGEASALQDVRDQHLKMLTLYSQVLEDVNNLLNLTMSFAAQRTNDVMRILTLFSVFFMPLTFIVGIYGMNFKHMPELGSKWGYPIVLIVMLIVAVIIYLWFKRKKWL